MTEQEKKLLLRNLSARLPYGVKATTTSNGWNGTYTITGYNNDRIYLDCPIYDEGDDEWLVESVKPYLRPLSSMTEEEREEWTDLFMVSITQEWEEYADELEAEKVAPSLFAKSHTLSIDWLNKKGFDYCGLIERGLALEAPEGMYK